MCKYIGVHFWHHYLQASTSFFAVIKSIVAPQNKKKKTNLHTRTPKQNSASSSPAFPSLSLSPVFYYVFFLLYLAVHLFFVCVFEKVSNCWQSAIKVSRRSVVSGSHQNVVCIMIASFVFTRAQMLRMQIRLSTAQLFYLQPFLNLPRTGREANSNMPRQCFMAISNTRHGL